MTDGGQSSGFGLYLHWPYCKAKCPYCDFNSHVSSEIDENRWIRAYKSEIRRLGAETNSRVLNTVYFGGGTPSLMSPALVATVLEEVRATWPVSNSFEVTLEANPTSAEAGRFQGYRDAGVNRMSMGIQSLNDSDLKALGRLHSVQEALTAFDLARRTFDRVNFDLIYARQHQSLSGWRNELNQALALSADHLSLYQLTIEDGTAFGERMSRGALKGLPNDDTSADMYFATQELCEAAGMPAYEVSNHASDGAESRHNLIYWHGGDYAGIGPGAHGRLTIENERFATETPLLPIAWLERVEKTGSGETIRQSLPGAEQAAEYMMMGLRLSTGISRARFEKLNGSPIPKEKLSHLNDLGMIKQNGDVLAATPKARPVLNAVIRELLI